MITVKHILVPTDCSELSEEAARYATNFAAQFKAKITLLMATPTEPLAVLNDYGYFSPELHHKLVTESNRRAESHLEHFWEKVSRPDVTATLVNVQGDPFSEIVRFSKEHEIDLIIMGTHGHTGLKHIFMGSVAEKVVRYSPQPVLTIKHKGYSFNLGDDG